MNAQRGGKRFGVWTWIVAAVSALLLVIGTAGSGIGGFFMMLGLVAVITGLYVVVTRRRSWAGLPRLRAVGAGVAVVGFVLVLAGGAAYGATHPRVDKIAPVATSVVDTTPAATPTPAVTPTPTVTPTRTATPTPTPTATAAPTAPAAPAQPAAPAPEPAAPAPAAPEPAAPAPAAPEPEPAQPETVHPGAFCSSAGATGVSKKGVPMVCSTTSSDSRLRWRSA